MEELEDDSMMPFGIHEGKTMEEVPAEYLLWLHGNLKQEVEKGVSLIGNRQSVYNYCEENLDVLQQEQNQQK